jgi:hypothetical protein
MSPTQNSRKMISNDFPDPHIELYFRGIYLC